MFSTLRHKVGSSLASYVERKSERKLRCNAELFADLTTYLEKTQSTSCSYSDLAVLYTHVRSLRPHTILELGTGVSTLVIAHALKLNGGGVVVSMEEGQKWYDQAVELMPPHLKKYVEIVYSPAVEKRWDFFLGAGYKDIPKRPYEFVFVDGPSFLSNPRGRPLGFNFDLIEILENSETPVTALIDSRQSTCYVYQQLLGNRFRFDYIRKIGIVLPSTKRDLRTGRSVVMHTMGRHGFKRPPLQHILSDRYM